ncbi:MAG: hypothetical protein H6974_14195 [Gammaproteobacteria bacterium]|nr:hypothetical protein [Gammaproteobacteria bacterium]
MNTSSEPKTMYERLLQDRNSEEDRARINQVRESLGIKPNDAVWAIFAGLEYYLTFFERFPDMVKDAGLHLLSHYKKETDQTLTDSTQLLRETANTINASLKQAVKEASQEAGKDVKNNFTQSAQWVARRAQVGRFWPWLLGGATIITLALALSIAVGFGYGRYAGYAEGWRDATVQRAAH